MQSDYSLQLAFLFLGDRKLNLTIYRHLGVIWDSAYPPKKAEKETKIDCIEGWSRTEPWFSTCMYMYLAYMICLLVQEFAIHLYSSLRDVKQRIVTTATVHLAWFWIITTLSGPFATQYPRNTHLLKFSTDRCTKILFTSGSSFSIGIPFQRSYLASRGNGSLNMQENTSIFLGSIQVY